MGIHGLAKLIGDVAPNATKENEFKNYFGRRIAIDASMSLYQFLIAVRQQDGMQLTTSDGDTTSHLMGFFYRTIRMIDNGIKPVYVFDGKPPEMKSGELEKRTERRNEAQKALEKAQEAGDAEEADKMQRRLVKVDKTHVAEAKQLLTFMGVPFVEAPCEAEAQCAFLQKTGQVFGVGTEDMDALTFGTKVLLRHLTFSEARKMPIKEFYLETVLEALQFTMDEFIDVCILLGCDYCDSIRGIGPKRALELMKSHRSIEKILDNIDKNKYTVPEYFPYKQARELFKNPEVDKTVQISWNMPIDEDGLINYMCNEKGFSEERMRSGVKKLRAARGKSTQGRLDSFFTVTKRVSESPGGSGGGAKKPKEEKKKGKGGGGRGGKFKAK
ncbi:unnamed protein product [Orchesella dallaii]|uniref:Flap endonuclease 1 n=1 Tax=Orchesella dallaii TaxID=48710 RepID=A0ABP1PKG9_9HEXA